MSSGVVIPELNVTFDGIKAATKNPGDWLTYSGTYNAQRHSPLSQITRDNVNRCGSSGCISFLHSWKARKVRQ